MTIMWMASFVFSSFFCIARSQQIYLNEKNECVRNDQTVLTLEDQIKFLRQENARQINALRKENAKQIDSLRQENAKKVDSLTKENARIKDDFDGMLKNISDSEEDLKSSILKIIVNGFNAKDCNDLYIYGITKSGVYKINPSGVESKLSVYCDMMVEGGGWTAFQKRVSGSVRFNRTWAEYKTGFGNPNDSYWIGNDVIHDITKGRNSSLYVSITLTNGTKLYELYNQFSVDDETNKYKLLLGGPATGTLGDAMHDTKYSWHDLSGMSFTTLDRDHDRDGTGNCAVFWGDGGGWWYNNCHTSNLNGPWSSSDWIPAWYPPLWIGSDITETLMMIKPY